MFFIKRKTNPLIYILVWTLLHWQMALPLLLFPQESNAVDTHYQSYCEKAGNEAERLAAKKQRETLSTQENEAAIQKFFEAIEKIDLVKLQEATLLVEQRTLELRAASGTLNTYLQTQVIPANRAATGDTRSYNEKQAELKKKYEECVAQAESSFTQCQSSQDSSESQGFTRRSSNCTYVKYKAVRVCRNKYVPSNSSKYSQLDTINNTSGATARANLKTADAKRGNMYAKSDALYEAIAKMADLDRTAYKEAYAKAVESRTMAVQVLASSIQANYQVTQASAARDPKQAAAEHQQVWNNAKSSETQWRTLTREDISDLFTLNYDISESTVRNVDLLAIGTAAVTDFNCDNVLTPPGQINTKTGDAYSVSYPLFVAASAIYLAEQTRLKNDFNANACQIAESNPDEEQKYDEQTVQVMIATNLRQETVDYGDRLGTASANVKEMYAWVDEIAQWEHRSAEARKDAAQALKEAAAIGKANVDAKQAYAESWKSMMQMLVMIAAAIMAACCGMTPPSCCPSAVAKYSKQVAILALAIAFLMFVMNKDQPQADNYVDMAQLEESTATNHSKLKCNEPRRDDKFQFSFQINNVTSRILIPCEIQKTRENAVLDFLERLYLELVPIRPANAEDTTASGSVGLKEGTGVYTFFMEEKVSHAEMMSGYSEQTPYMGFAETDYRKEYTKLLAGLGDVVYRDMEQMTLAADKTIGLYNQKYSDLTSAMQLKMGSNKEVDASQNGNIGDSKVGDGLTGANTNSSGDAEYGYQNVGTSGNVAMKTGVQSDKTKTIASGNSLEGKTTGETSTVSKRLQALRIKTQTQMDSLARKMGVKSSADATDQEKMAFAEKILTQTNQSVLSKMIKTSEGDSKLSDLLAKLKRRSDGSKSDQNKLDFKDGEIDYSIKGMEISGYQNSANDALTANAFGNDGSNSLGDAEGLNGPKDALMGGDEYAGEYDANALEQEKSKYSSAESDTLWRKITKAYIRIGYPVLLRKKQ